MLNRISVVLKYEQSYIMMQFTTFNDVKKDICFEKSQDIPNEEK